MGTLSSVWIGYGCETGETFWTEAFEAWWMSYRTSVPLVSDLWVLMVAIATTTKVHAEHLGIVELPYDTVFRLARLTDAVPGETVRRAVFLWQQFRSDAAAAGFQIPCGHFLFAHLVD